MNIFILILIFTLILLWCSEGLDKRLGKRANFKALDIYFCRLGKSTATSSFARVGLGAALSKGLAQ